ncbi:MAG: chorismate synthase [Flavobacteriales bacterium]|nr:chorismate synthase [Flavobacteriales bacterium]
MPGNSIGLLFRLTTFGESHGAAIGGVVDGCPAGLKLDLDAVQLELDRRRPGSTSLGTARDEADRVEWLSGIHEGITLGAPIAFLIRNRDARSSDYDALKDIYRPGHADYTWEGKYGLRDHRGGGRSSARTTAACVVGGAIARQLIARNGIAVQAFVSRVGDVILETMPADLSATWANAARCPDSAVADRMKALIEAVRAEGDSIGGIVSCMATGMPIGLGEPVFDKLDADLAKAMLSINAAKGFQIGSGFASARMRGSENNDDLHLGRVDEDMQGLPEGARVQRPAVRSRTNHAGGSLGGISNGEDLAFEVAFKPPATIGKAQRTVNKDLEEVVLEAKGRHDPCVVPRAVPIVEAMACMVLADHVLRQRTARMAALGAV